MITEWCLAGSAENCASVLHILKKIGLQADIEYHHTVEHGDHNDAVVVLLHREKDDALSVQYILDALMDALVCNKDRAKYISMSAEMEGQVHIFYGRYDECILVQRMLASLHCEIRDYSTVAPPTLTNLCQKTVVDNLDTMQLQHLPQEMLEKLLLMTLKKGKLTLERLKRILDYNCISELDFSVSHCAHSLYLSPSENANPITDEWLALIGQYSCITSINLSNSCENITKKGLECLKELPLHSLLLQHSNLKDSDMSVFKTGFSHLQFLSLSHSIELTDACLASIANLKQLASLNISFCPQITAEGVAQLQKDLPTLQNLTRQVQKKTRQGSPFQQLFQTALNQVRDRLPNERDIPEDRMSQLVGNEINSILRQNPGLRTVFMRGVEDDSDDEDEWMDDSDELEEGMEEGLEEGLYDAEEVEEFGQEELERDNRQ